MRARLLSFTAVTFASLVTLGTIPFVSPHVTLVLTTALSITTVLLAVVQWGDEMRADVRAGLRELRSEVDHVAANDSRPPPVVFSGPVKTVILSQIITARTVHIAGPDKVIDEEEAAA
jgi:hypothetical protein